MKTKIEIIENLCNNGAIDFREALILLDKEVTLSSYTITTYPNYTTTTHYCTFLPSAMDARVCDVCGMTKELHKIK